MSLPICKECDRSKAFPIRVGGLCAFCLNARAEKAEAELATEKARVKELKEEVRLDHVSIACLHDELEKMGNRNGKAESELAKSEKAILKAEELITREIGKPPQGRDWNKIHEAALVLRSYMFLKEQEGK